MNVDVDNIILLTDSYKPTHAPLYPPKTSTIYSYLESRGGEFDYSVFFGLQYFAKKYLEGPVVTKDKIEEAEYVLNHHFGQPLMNKSGWNDIVNKYGGYLPIEIKAVKEGSIIPTKNVLLTTENTDDNHAWLTNSLETLLVELWYPITVATQSRVIKERIKQALEDTGSLDGLDFKLHDFGFRGVSCPEQARIGGSAHLINFMGTDTLASIQQIRKYYGVDKPDAYSIPATEHSTITAWGKENEAKAYENVLKQYPTGLVACVSDSYDIENACKNIWGKELKDKVLARDGVLVVRPDSGYPPDIVCDCLTWLGDAFGWTKNDKGYKVLNPKVRLIQGDGIDRQMVDSILTVMRFKGWSADNIAFGSGGGLLQKLNRDTCKFAVKCSYAKIDGKDIEVFKDPVTDQGKSSKKGKLVLVKRDGKYITENLNDSNSSEDLLETVFLNGHLTREQSFTEIKELAKL